MRNTNNLCLLAAVLALVTGCSKKNAEISNSESGIYATLKTNSTQLSGPGDVVGKVTVGYQGWFSASGDGSPLNSWGHMNLENWPDVRQYTTTYSGVPFNQAGTVQPAYTGNLGNGQPAKMFSSDDQQVANTHCLWMQQNGIDCIALQRFGSYTDAGAVKNFHDAVDLKIMNAAQTYGRKFYIMYDCSSGDSTKVKNDWLNTIVSTQHLTSSSAYARQNGKPVVCFWGVGKSGRGTTTGWVSLINWFKAQGIYVIGGPLSGFANDTPNYPAYNACDMIMPWMVGKTASANFASIYAADLAYCNAHNIDYQADIYPGTAFYNTNGVTKNVIPRTHGDFMWTQFAAAKNAGVTSVYISMFDEMNEATGILNCAEDASWIPAGKYFLTLDAEGTHVSSDFYLRLVNDGSKMIKGTIAYTATHPTPHTFAPPASLTPHVLSSSSIQINWSAVTNCPAFNVKRATTSGGPYTTVATGVTANTFTNTGLSANTTYYYVVTAGRVNASESGNSMQVSGKTNP